MSDVEEVIQVSSAAEFLSVLRPDNKRWGGTPTQWFFRGQSGSREPRPTAYRDDSWPPFRKGLMGPVHQPSQNYPQQLDRQEIEETELLRRFLFWADAAGLAVPEHARARDILQRMPFKPEDLDDRALQAVMALAQHHGIPTRLLDVTRSSLHAAYFAASGAAAKVATTPGVQDKLSVWALPASFLLRAGHLAGAAIQLRVVTTATAANANLRAQLGLFLLWWHEQMGVRTFDLKGVLQNLADAIRAAGHPWPHPVYFKFQLPWSESAQLLRLLGEERIDGSRMYPGYDGVTRALKEQGVWDRYVEPSGSVRDGFFY